MVSDEKKCAILGKVLSFLEQNPDGVEKLEQMMLDSKWLMSTDDVAEITGWSNGHIIRLCKQGVLPYIPGNPHKFMYKPLMVALEQLQTGGMYGKKTRMKRRKSA